MLERGPDQISQTEWQEDFLVTANVPMPAFRALTWRRPSRWGRLADIEWMPDLSQSVGSFVWFRGAATLLALTLFALAFWPRLDWSPVGKANGAVVSRLSPNDTGPANQPIVAKPRLASPAAEPEPLRLRGRAGDSLYSAASAAGAPGAIIQGYLGILARQLGTEFDLQPDDIFDLVIARRRTPQGDIQLGDLLYAGLERAGSKRAEMLRWGTEGAFLEGSSQERLAGGGPSNGFARPIGGAITSGFGLRIHPLLGMVRMHSGIDYAAAWGTPVHAAGAGTVSFAAPRGGYGNYVRIDHGGGIDSAYGHLSFISVAAGARVQAGQLIGLVGSTGLSTGPHLHYEMLRDGVAVNPKDLPLPGGKAEHALDGSQQAAFGARLAALMALNPAVTTPVQ